MCGPILSPYNAALIAIDAENLGTTALIHRALGEMAALELNMDAAKNCFSEIDSICAEMGIPLRCIYNMEVHWYILPDDRFPAWPLYLARQ